jgi:hypothetical protein
VVHLAGDRHAAQQSGQESDKRAFERGIDLHQGRGRAEDPPPPCQNLIRRRQLVYAKMDQNKERKMKKIKQFGETVEGYNIPVINEREIRASAGILFIFMFFSWMLVIFKESFFLIKFVNTIFLTDFILRVMISPKYSPSLIIGRLIVGGQTPEYVGAAQKKFAWTIGLVLATIIFLLLVVMNSTSFITGIICQICLIFLFFEAVFGICLGCKFYPMFHKEKTQYCPGEICDVKVKQEIQKTSLLQIVVVIGFIAFVITTAILFNDRFSAIPTDLWAIVKSVLSI